MKDLRKTEEYKKAYSRADRICKYMPHLVGKMSSPKTESPAQKQAFEDRITEFQIEQDSINNMSRKSLLKRYGAKLNRYNQHKPKDLERSRD